MLFYLKRSKILKTPVSGMAYGDIAVAGSLLLGSLFISTAASGSLFQSAKVLGNAGTFTRSAVFMKCSEFFFLGLVITIVFMLIHTVNSRIFFREIDQSAHENSISRGILIACLNFGFAALCWFCYQALAEMVTPEVMNFR